MKKKAKMTKWPDADNYSELHEVTKENPDAAAYEYEGENVTYKELLRNIDRVATGLKSVNIRKGDKVIVSLPDIPQAIESYYAMDKAGIYSYTLHPDTKASAIAAIAEELHSKAVITVDSHYEEISKAVAGLDHPVQIILADVNGKKTKSKFRRSLLRKNAQKKYAKDEHITPWSKLI